VKSTLLQRCRRYHALEKDGKKTKCDHLLLVNWEMTDADLFQKQYVLLIGLMLFMFVGLCPAPVASSVGPRRQVPVSIRKQPDSVGRHLGSKGNRL